MRTFSLIAIQSGAAEMFQSGAQWRTHRHRRPSITEERLRVLYILQTFPMHVSQVLNTSHCYDVMSSVTDTLLQIWGFVFTTVLLTSFSSSISAVLCLFASSSFYSYSTRFTLTWENNGTSCFGSTCFLCAVTRPLFRCSRNRAW